MQARFDGNCDSPIPAVDAPLGQRTIRRMMRKTFLATIVLGLNSALTLAGTIRFDPETVRVDLSTSATTITVEVFVESSGALADFTSMVMLLGANDLTITEFEFAPEFIAAFDLRDARPQSDTSPYNSGILIEAFGFSSSTAPIRVGTVTIDALGLPQGSYVAGVDTLVDITSSALASANSEDENEPLWGFVTVEVIGSYFPPSPSAGCISDAECGASGACTTVSCDGGLCVSTPVQDCGECTVDADCNDGNPCTDGLCSANLCQFVENAAACNDGDPCTDGDVCIAFACSGTPISDCSDTRIDPGSVEPDPIDPGTTDPGPSDDPDPDPTTPSTSSGLCGSVGLLPLALTLFAMITSRRQAPLKAV